MNPGLFNKRIKFLQETAPTDEFGGANPVLAPVPNVSDATDPSTTWGSLEPIRQYHQFAIEAGASVMNGDKILKIKKRAAFTPNKSMVFQDVSNPGITETYTIVTVSPYWPGTKSGFQNNQETTYHDQYFLYIVGVRRI